MVSADKTYNGKPCVHGHGTLRWKANGACVECTRTKGREYMVGYRATRKEKSDEWREANRPRMAWLYARKRAREKNVPFTVQLSDLPPVPDRCPVLGMPMSFGADTPLASSPSLDRIVPEMGYVPGNVHWISHRANSIKRDATPDELRRVAAYFTALELSHGS